MGGGKVKVVGRGEQGKKGKEGELGLLDKMKNNFLKRKIL